MKRTKQSKIVDDIVTETKKPIVNHDPSLLLLPTGSTVLNLTVGGGYPVGKIINIVGDKSTGKTLFAIELIACARKLFGKKLKWFYDDAETGFSFNTKEMYGFDIVAEDKDCSTTIEEFDANLTKQLNKLKKDDILIYVLDSLDGLTAEDEIKVYEEQTKALEQGKKAKGTYGLTKQKALSRFFRIKNRAIKDHNCLLVIISQVRSNIGFSFGPKFTRTGGKALDFYASIILWLAEVEKHKKKGRATGVCVKAKATKVKIGKPFRECYVELLFDYGIDDITSSLNFLYDLKTDTGKNKTRKQKVKWDDADYSIKRLIKYIEEENLEQELKQRVIDKWYEIEKSISSERKDKWK